MQPETGTWMRVAGGENTVLGNGYRMKEELMLKAGE